MLIIYIGKYKLHQKSPNKQANRTDLIGVNFSIFNNYKREVNESY